MQLKTSKHTIREVGQIISFFTGVGKVRGLGSVKLHEVLIDDENTPSALVIGFDKDTADIITFDEHFDYARPLFSTGKVFKIPVSDHYLGRVVDGSAKPLDGKSHITGKLASIFQPSPQVIDRTPIKRALVTGIKILDATLPIGRGQRELIIGDRKLGKTTLALDTVINQEDAEPKVFCVYVICGRKDAEIDKIVNQLEDSGAMRYTTVVAAPASASLALQYLAPAVGTTIAEYFSAHKKDALVVYDDLTSHAKVARSIALLLKRPPGREVYPGDIFSLHAQLLERSAQLSPTKGGGSLTSLPIIETQEGDLASYIPTNLISITDGQIYLSRDIYDKNSLPAIDIGLSVSRIGAQAQPTNLKAATQALRLSLAQYKELEKLSQLEGNLSKKSQENINRGQVILNLLRQDKHTFVSWEEQAVMFIGATTGKFDSLPKADYPIIEKYLLEFLTSEKKVLLKNIATKPMDHQLQAAIAASIDEFTQKFLATTAGGTTS